MERKRNHSKTCTVISICLQSISISQSDFFLHLIFDSQYDEMFKIKRKENKTKQKRRRQNALNQNSNVFHLFIFFHRFAKLRSFYFCNKSALTRCAMAFSSHWLLDLIRYIRCALCTLLTQCKQGKKINIINLSMKENAVKIMSKRAM